LQEPTEDDEALIPTEIVSMSYGPNLLRKVAKRTLPWDQAAGELDLVSLQPQAEDIPAARKKPRLEEPLPTTTDEAARNTASPDVPVGLPPPTDDDDDVNAHPSRARGRQVTGHQQKTQSCTVQLRIPARRSTARITG
jgi:hypothetical protein